MKNQEFSDEVYQMAMPEINDIFDDITIEQLMAMSYSHMPSDVKCALDKAQARYDKEHEIYPLSSSTDSKDGKTCDWCKETLVVKTSTISSSAGIIQKKVMACPNGGLKCKINHQQNDLNNLVTESQKNMENIEDVYVLSTRHMEIADVKALFMKNYDTKLVTTPNTQFTELIFGLKTLFRQELKKGEIKKTVTTEICGHILDRDINLEDGTIDATPMDIKNKEEEGKPVPSRYYRLISVKEIGRIGLQSEYNCNVCRDAGEIISQDWQEEKLKEKAREIIKNNVRYLVEYQRIDSEIEKDIVELLRDTRLCGSSKYFKASEIHDLILRKHYTWLVARLDKSFYASRLKKLANNGILEVQVLNWEFGFHVDGNFHRYENHLDNASTLNEYRWFNEHSIHLVGSMRKELNQITEEMRYSKTKELYARKHQVFANVAKQLGLDSTEITIGREDGQINLVCKVKKHG